MLPSNFKDYCSVLLGIPKLKPVSSFESEASEQYRDVSHWEIKIKQNIA